MATLSAPTIEDLITNVRTMLRQPDPTNSSWKDEELAGYLNEGVRRYFSEVVLHSEGQFAAQEDLDLVSGADTVALPGDCFRVKAVYRKVSNGWELLSYRNNLTEGYSSTGASGGDAYQPYYYLRANSLVLRPGPGFSETDGLRLEYIAFPETMITGGDSMTAQVSPVFKDLIEIYAVYKAKLTESLVSGTNTYAPALQNLNDLFTAFKEAIAQRSEGNTAIKPFNPEEY